MTHQDQINQAEWENPDNWGGPDLIAVYFSKKDTRTWVPKKNPRAGWVQNLATRSGVYWFWGLFIGIILFCNLVWAVAFLGASVLEKDTKPPRVVSTFPENGTQDVDPALNKITVTFNEEMMDQNWSWVYQDKAKFPRIVGQAYYTNNNTVNVLPVKLEPNKEYIIWINSNKFRNFKDKSGNSAVPFKFTFRTRSSE
jgi:hypothetical protein